MSLNAPDNRKHYSQIMADLNDFFARKDKKKSKTTKYTTLNNIDQKLREMDLKREKAQRNSSDDEWKRFEEKKIDYTGLKIQNSTLQEEDCEESDKDGEETSCPWSTITHSQGSLEEEGNSVQRETRAWKTIEAPVQQEKPAPTVRAYVPPHLRNKPAPASGTGKFNKAKGLRDENVENMFPSLPTTGSASAWENKAKIHESHVPSNNTLKLTLENKFGTLSNKSD